MEQPQRKNLRIPNFDYAQNGAYFVTFCVLDRQPLLSEIVGANAQVNLRPLGQILETFIRNAPEIDHFVIMPDHVHLLIRLSGSDQAANRNRVSTIVRSIKTLTTKSAGRAIFQRSYYDHVIRNQADYNEVYEYISNNPMRWAMKNRGWE